MIIKKTLTNQKFEEKRIAPWTYKELRKVTVLYVNDQLLIRELNILGILVTNCWYAIIEILSKCDIWISWAFTADTGL